MKNAIFIGSDHAGFELKEKINEFLKQEGCDFEDLGPYKFDSDDDYPDYAIRVCKKVLETNGRGILICSTGQGMGIAANKIPGIRAFVCWNEETARHAKENGNANVICFGGRFVDSEVAKNMVKIWLETSFKNEEKYVRRIDKIKKIEENT